METNIHFIFFSWFSGHSVKMYATFAWKLRSAIRLRGLSVVFLNSVWVQQWVSQYLVLVEQLLGAAQGVSPVFSGDGGQSVAQPGHFLLQVSVELEQNLPGLQGFPATLQGLRQTVVSDREEDHHTSVIKYWEVRILKDMSVNQSQRVFKTVWVTVKSCLMFSLTVRAASNDYFLD